MQNARSEVKKDEKTNGVRLLNVYKKNGAYIFGNTA
jgi:hypothetical protein